MDLGGAYAGDSFLTLGTGGRVGLLLLSALLWAGMLALGWRLRGAIGAFGGVALFWAFLWLSPQVYYLYYQAIFDGLPWQVVIAAPPDPARLLRLLTFTDAATLSAHGKGALGWSLIALAPVRAAMRRLRA